jgi:hypothetical protein
MVMWATKGYSPGEASLPPTTACAGAVAPRARATVARMMILRGVMLHSNVVTARNWQRLARRR